MRDLIQFQLSFTGYEQRDGKLYIDGFASTPELDRYNSIVEANSFQEGIKNYLKNPVILLGHNPDKAIGVMVDHKLDASGLWIKAEISSDIDNVFADITEGRTRGFSIGFVPIKSEYKTRDGRNLKDLTEDEYNQLEEKDVVRVISQIDLAEISVVNVPANPSTLFSLGKAVRAYFDKLEKRSMMDMQRRILINNKDNPFIDEEEPKQEEKKEEVEEQKESEAVSEKVEEVAPVSDPSENIDSPESPEKEEVAEEVPAPAPEQEVQTGDESEVKKELEEERKLNDELIEKLERATAIMEKMQKEIETKAVNRPAIYAHGPVKDAFAQSLRMAKGV